MIGMGSTLLSHSFFQHFEATRGEYFFLLLSSLFGLILIGASIFIISMSIFFTKTNHLVNFDWILASGILQGISELLIAPIGFAMIAKIATPESQGVMMGSWLMLLSIGAVLAGYLSQISSNLGFSFMLLGGASILIGITILSLRLQQVSPAK